MFWERIRYPVNPDHATQPPVEPSPRRRALDPLSGRPLGRVLVRMQKATREQVIEALMHQKKHGGLLGDVMVKLGFVQSADVEAALVAQRGERT